MYSIKNIALILFLVSCNKSKFLDQKPSSQLLVPTTVKHFQAILDNDNQMNDIVPFLAEAGADNYYCNSDFVNSLPVEYRNMYIWDDKIWSQSNDGISYNWSYPYGAVFNANVVLDGLANINPNSVSQEEMNNLKGSALFVRSYAFYQLTQIFTAPFDATTADKELGIPLRLQSDINEELKRGKLSDTYSKIIADLKESLSLLPNLPKYKNRPSKAAAYALLSRIYLGIKNYDLAIETASKCLDIQGELIDYNDLNPSSPIPIEKNNIEVIYPGEILNCPLFPIYMSETSGVDTLLIQSYHMDDLRRKIFYEPVIDKIFSFKGSYEGSSALFGGIATDEIYLIRSECFARLGNLSDALDDLNRLVEKRWVKDNFTPFYAETKDEVLGFILEERRKELVFRGLRWYDLRRLNSENYGITLTRILGDQTYSLTPNNSKYAYLIPIDVIKFHPEMPQNKR